MGREYLVGDQLVGKDVGSSAAPQVGVPCLGAYPGLSMFEGCTAPIMSGSTVADDIRRKWTLLVYCPR